MGSENLHERDDLLSEETKNLHRAIVSLMEELEAVDWYTQRAEACTDDELKAVLVHNRDEEIEHAMMTLEWIRRNKPEFDENIATYLNADGPIVGVEASAEGKSAPNEGAGTEGGKPAPAKATAGGGGGGGGSSAKGGGGSLGIGSLKGR